MKQHFQQIDILKGLAIIAVLLLHSLSREQLIASYAVFHIWQAVPIFMVLMGLNLGMSYSSKTLHFDQLYTPHYFQKKALRIIFPLLLMYVISLVAGFVWEQVYAREVYTLGWKNLIGVLPVSGKGNYFITLLLQSLIVLPLIGYTFNRWPVRTSLVLVFVEIVFQLIAYQIPYFEEDRYLYDAALFRYFSAIALGLWLSRLITTSDKRYSWLLLIAGIGSGLYLYFHQSQGISLPYIRPEWQAQLFLTFPYAALLIFAGILAFPQQSGFAVLQTIATIGKASYHIFLAQVLYFGLVQDDMDIALNLAVCLIAGGVFYWLESYLSKKLS
ncbi:acyltransferase family protein [Pontibacter virosus]|uniref:Peptidoglycan/LPS O-acetylase OafA/YrhL n=1 Tax=Pontibacter virosus TaxID=1765052 RepID=A0A2U1AW62_9BACT|nr:acyltransferase [Pontibacter virosus]PVY40679.1 peptidoglycan/LPS O-acetylase OafA/YrhL [Pontibacter virosus]